MADQDVEDQQVSERAWAALLRAIGDLAPVAQAADVKDLAQAYELLMRHT